MKGENWIKRRHQPNHCVTRLWLRKSVRAWRRRVVCCYLFALHHDDIVEPQAIPPIIEHPEPPSTNHSHNIRRLLLSRRRMTSASCEEKKTGSLNMGDIQKLWTLTKALKGDLQHTTGAVLLEHDSQIYAFKQTGNLLADSSSEDRSLEFSREKIEDIRMKIMEQPERDFHVLLPRAEERH